jgi:MFS transporter, ACDE family, multidrug resistance protein
MAVNGMILRMGQTLAPLLMGLVYSLGGLNQVYITGAAICVLMFLLALRLRKH